MWNYFIDYERAAIEKAIDKELTIIAARLKVAPFNGTITYKRPNLNLILTIILGHH